MALEFSDTRYMTAIGNLVSSDINSLLMAFNDK